MESSYRIEICPVSLLLVYFYLCVFIHMYQEPGTHGRPTVHSLPSLEKKNLFIHSEMTLCS